MKLQGKALRKWTLITIVCGATSFFWGVLTKASPTAMVLGVATLILIFSLVESHPGYQARRAAKPLMARALVWGVRVRVGLALYIVASLVSGTILPSLKSLEWLSYPYMGELLIGIYSMMLCQKLIGIDMNALSRMPAESVNQLDHFIGTYVTTLVTGIAHTIILALICCLIYGAMYWRTKYPSKTAAE